MSGAYVAKPAAVVAPLDIPPGWNPIWSFPGPCPPGYTPSLLLTGPSEINIGDSATIVLALLDAEPKDTFFAMFNIDAEKYASPSLLHSDNSGSFTNGSTFLLLVLVTQNSRRQLYVYFVW